MDLHAVVKNPFWEAGSVSLASELVTATDLNAYSTSQEDQHWNECPMDETLKRKIELVQELRHHSILGGGEVQIVDQHAKGKLLARGRLDLLLEATLEERELTPKKHGNMFL